VGRHHAFSGEAGRERDTRAAQAEPPPRFRKRREQGRRRWSVRRGLQAARRLFTGLNLGLVRLCGGACKPGLNVHHFLGVS
jgi:hypothetical protein